MESVNVTKTLIEYMTSNADTAPELAHSATMLLSPINQMPFCEERRSERLPNQCGTQESWAILAKHLGPPMKPACAATTSNVASARMVIHRKTCDRGAGKTLDANLFDPDREREILEVMVREGPLVDGVTGRQAGLVWLG